MYKFMNDSLKIELKKALKSGKLVLKNTSNECRPKPKASTAKKSQAFKYLEIKRQL